MVVDKLPELRKNEPCRTINQGDKITMYGEGNASKMVGDMRIDRLLKRANLIFVN